MAKNLNIFAKDLGRDASIMLSFLPLDGISVEQHQICWVLMPAQGPYMLPVTYTSQILFIKPEIDNSNIVHDGPSGYMPVDVGQTTTFVQQDSGYAFTAPKNVGGDSLQVVNGTTESQDLAIGFMAKSGYPTSVLYFKGVSPGDNITTKFTPVLRIYVCAGYKENQIIDGVVQGPVIWTQDLNSLGENTTLKLTYGMDTGSFYLDEYQ